MIWGERVCLVGASDLNSDPTHVNPLSINQMLQLLGARLLPSHSLPFSDLETANLIVAGQPHFHELKSHLAHPNQHPRISKSTELRLSALLALFEQRRWLHRRAPGQYLRTNAASFAYINGGWLEEYVWFAACAVGMDEAYFGQKISWQGSNGAEGVNEIDVLLRRKNRLLMISCKAISPHPEPGKTMTLSDHAKEVGYWLDHFCPQQGYGVLVSTADMVDESIGRDRYPVAEFRAEVQNVEILGLEDLEFGKLCAYLSDDRQWT